jgi:hypothetical protein
VDVRGDEERRRMTADDELADADVPAEREASQEAHEAGLDVATDQRWHALTSGPGPPEVARLPCYFL